MPRAKKKLAPLLPLAPYVTTMLENISSGKSIVDFPAKAKIYTQGDAADAIYFVESGKVKVSVVSAAGKEAVLSLLGPHDFF